MFNPGYTDHIVLSPGDNKIAIWSSGNGSNDNVYITRVDEVLHAEVPEKSNRNLTIYPNPAADYTEVRLPPGFS